MSVVTTYCGGFVVSGFKVFFIIIFLVSDVKFPFPIFKRFKEFRVSLY